MKKLGYFAIVTLVFTLAFVLTATAELDTEQLEQLLESLHMYESDGFGFLEPDLPAEKRSFSHKNDSHTYQSYIFPDLFFYAPGTDEEIVIPRISILYRTEDKALRVENVEFSLYNSRYNFSIRDTNIIALDKGTVSEEIYILIGEQSLNLMRDWYYTASINAPMNVKLIGASDTVEFSIPESIVSTGSDLFQAYTIAGGNKSLNDYSETPVTITAISEPIQRDSRYLFTNKLNGTTFYIPDGWSIVRDEHDDISSQAKFHWESDDQRSYSNIQYKSVDFYTQTLQEENISVNDADISRAEMNNSILTKADISELFGVPASEIKYEKCGNYEYYVCDVTAADSWLGYDVSVSLKAYCNIYNGYLNIFSLAGDFSKLNDFMFLLNSVVYPN